MTVRILLGLSLFLGAPGWAADAPSFDRTLSLQGITFHIEEKAGELHITPSGLKIDNSPIVVPVRGRVANAEIADLNADGSPEIYVYVQEAGDVPHLTLIAYSANNLKSLSPIVLPELTGEAAAEFKGNDEMATVEGTLVRRFPIANGKTRQLQYKLRMGEATWILKLDKSLTY